MRIKHKKPRIKWSSRKKDSKVLMGKRQVGGNLVLQSFRLLTRYGGTGSIIHGMPGAIGTGIRTATQAITRSASTSPGGTAAAATGVATTIGSAMSSFSLASVVSGLAAVGGAIANRNPESLRFFANVLLRTFSSPPPLVSELSKIASDTAAAAGDTLGAAVAKVPIEPIYPVSGPINPEVIKAMSPKDIRQYFADNKSLLKIPDGVKDTLLLKAPVSTANIKAQQEAFFKTMVFNGLVEGSPAEILAHANEMLGETAARNLLASVANPAIEAQQTALHKSQTNPIKAAINAAPGNKDKIIRQEAIRFLEETASREAEALVVAKSGLSPISATEELTPSVRLRGMMNEFMGVYESFFGRTPIQLTDDLIPTGSQLPEILRAGVTSEGIASYITWLPTARSVFSGMMTPTQRTNFNNVMTAEVRSQFVSGMLRLMNEDPVQATIHFENFALNIVPHIHNGNAQQILSEFFGTLRQAPRGEVNRRTGEIITDLLHRFSIQAVSISTTTLRTASTLPLRLLQRAIAAGTTGIVGLFILSLRETPNGGGFPQGGADAVRDRVYEWFGIQLWQTPAPDNTWAGQLAVAAGFERTEAGIQQWRAWLAGQARGWLWNFMGAILAGIGLTAGAAATRLISFFGGTPPAEVRELTEDEINRIDPSATSGGSKPTQKTRRNR